MVNVMEEKGWLDYLEAVGTISTPILVLVVGTTVWKYRQSIELNIKLEEQLRDDRIEIYNQILEPFIVLLMSDAAWASDPKNKNKDKSKFATTKMLSLEYKKTSFRLSLIGSDSVVSAYNDLCQYFYNRADMSSSSPSDIRETISLLGSFLLEIRKSMGNESTKIDNWGMVEWFLTDVKGLRETRYVS